MFGTLPGPFFQHADVLTTEKPNQPEALTKLLEELKRRGNAAFKVKSYLEAEALYGRAIELDAAVPSMWGNRAATRLGMKQYAQALADADEAIKVDEKWSKGHFRRGQALAGLGRHADAKAAFERAASLLPTECPEAAAALKEAEKAGQLMASVPAVATPAKTTTTTTTTTTTKKAAAAQPKQADAEVDASMRGYKVLDDGRKTSYFHRELSPEEKAMLAHNKPKSLDATALPQPINPHGGSAWNAAGTFEERDMSAWAKDKLKELLVGVSTFLVVQPQDETLIVEATGISDLDGGATVSFIRGSKRYPFDYTLSVDWACEIPAELKGKGDKPGKAAGKLFVREFTSESDDIECEVRWEGRDASAGPHVAPKLIEHLKKEFRQAVEDKLREFKTVFKTL